MRRIQHEANEQIALFEWASYHPILREYLIHIPNGGSRHPIEARNLKRQGVKAGVPDLLLAYPRNNRAGLFMELKRGGKCKGVVSVEQANWLNKLKDVGYEVYIAYGFDEAKDKLLNYLA